MLEKITKFIDGNKNTVDDEIDAVLEEMAIEHGDTDRYKKLADNLRTLYEIKATSKKTKIDPNTLITAGASLAGILLVLHYEKVDVIATKALGFIPKVRL